MLRRAILSAVVVGLTILGVGAGAFGQSQRLGFAPGSYSLAPRGARVIDGFCHDEDLIAPSSGASMRYVLNADPRDAQVRIGNRGPISMQEAIEQKLVSVEAQGFGAVGSPGDGRHVRLQNMTDEPMRVEFAKPVLFSETRRAAVDSTRFVIPTGVAEADHQSAQEAIWMDLESAKALTYRSAQEYSVSAFASERVLSFFRLNDRAYVLGIVADRPALRVIEGGKVTVRATGPEAWRQWNDAVAHAVSAYQDRGVTLARIAPVPDRTAPLHLQMGRQSIDMTGEEFVSLLDDSASDTLRSRIFPPGQPVHDVFVWRDPTEQGRGTPLTKDLVVDAMDLYHALKNAAGTRANIYLATDPATAVRNAGRLPAVKGPADVVLISDSRSIDDQGVVDVLEQTWAGHGMRVIGDATIARLQTLREVREANVVVLVGHKDFALKAYVSTLGSSGATKGKFVALFSCGEGGDEAFNTLQLLQRVKNDGARGVLFFDEQVDPEAVARVLTRFSEIVSRQPAATARMDRVIDAAIESALREPGLDDRLRAQIRKLRGHIIQVSANEARTVERFEATAVALKGRREASR